MPLEITDRARSRRACLERGFSNKWPFLDDFYDDDDDNCKTLIMIKVITESNRGFFEYDFLQDVKRLAFFIQIQHHGPTSVCQAVTSTMFTSTWMLA